MRQEVTYNFISIFFTIDYKVAVWRGDYLRWRINELIHFIKGFNTIVICGYYIYSRAERFGVPINRLGSFILHLIYILYYATKLIRLT